MAILHPFELIYLFDRNASQLIFHNGYIRAVFETNSLMNGTLLEVIASLEKTTNYVLLQS